MIILANMDAFTQWLDNHAFELLTIIAVTLLAFQGVRWLMKRLENALVEKRETEDTKQLTQSVLTTLRWTLLAGVLLVAVIVSITRLGIATGAIVDQLTKWLMDSGVTILIILVGAGITLRVAAFLSTRLLALLKKSDKADPEFQKRAETLNSVVRWLLRMVVFGVATLMVLSEFGVDLAPILAAAGVVGLAVGFGAQNLVQDVIAGFFILLEDQIRVGDVVQLDGRGGLVEKITLRMTILRDLAGSVHYVRNGKIDVVTNMTKDYSRYVFDVSVAYRENVDQVIKVMKEVDEDLRQDPDFRNDIIQPLEVLGLDKFADSAVVVKARTTTKPIQQWRVGREFNRRLKKRFDELGIEIPFPHLTLYAGQDQQGNAPAFRVAPGTESPAKPPSTAASKRKAPAKRAKKKPAG